MKINSEVIIFRSFRKYCQAQRSSDTKSQILCHLREALQRLRTAKLSLNPDKCEFVKFSVEYLGHTISANGISPSPDKVTAMQNTQPPRNLRALRGFICLFSYYRR